MRRVPVVLLLLAAAAAAKGWPEKEPGPKAKGKVYLWRASNGGEYLYRVPKGYDHEQGANLTFILHGSSGGKWWGMVNCPVASDFRPDDVVVSPDGSQKHGEAYNRMANQAELEYLHTLHTELKQVFNIRQTFIYGHSQGSYFAHYYAASYPDEVDGYVAFASNIWLDVTPLAERNHHQAIVVMHGTHDPVVPYAWGDFAYGKIVEAGYPKVRFRTLEGWNHWPTDNNSKVPHTAQQLAWCEGMTTKDPERLEECFEFLVETKAREWNDYAGIHALAKHIEQAEIAPDALKKKAERARRAVEALAEQHVKALKLPDEPALSDDAWIGHLPMFLRNFRGVPAREALAEKWEAVLAAHREAAVPHLQAFHRSQDVVERFAAGVEAIRVGYLHYECLDTEKFRKPLTEWRKDKKLKLPKEAVKAYDEVVPDFDDAQKDGRRAFDSLNRKAKL